MTTASAILITMLLNNREDRPVMKRNAVQRQVNYPALNPDNYSAGDGWVLAWSDEFTAPELDSEKWTSQVIHEPFNEEWQDYRGDPENAYIDDGYLVIKAIHHGSEHAPRHYTSARLHTAQKGAWQYGKFVARIQLPYGQGVWPAFWLLGENIDENGGDVPWPASGEIDIMELYGSKDDSAVEVNMHYEDGGHKSMGAAAYRLDRGLFADEFHAFELEWNARELIWRVDGNEVTRAPIDAPRMSAFHQPYFILLNLAIGGTWSGKPDETTPFPALMYIDWVRVYRQQTTMNAK